MVDRPLFRLVCGLLWAAGVVSVCSFPLMADGGPALTPPPDADRPSTPEVSPDQQELAESVAPSAPSQRQLRALSRAVNSELIDLSRALRSLDQSFHYRGLMSRKAGTASSAYRDWHAQGIDLPRTARVVPPPPRFLDCGPGVRPEFFWSPVVPRDLPPCETCRPDDTASSSLDPLPPLPSSVAPNSAARAVAESLDLVTVHLTPPVVWKLVPSANASLNDAGFLRSGSVRVTGIEAALSSAIRRSGVCDVQFLLDVHSPAGERSDLIRWGSDSAPFFSLVFENGLLSSEFAASASGKPLSFPLTRLEKGLRTVRLVLERDRLRVWSDGELVATTRAVGAVVDQWSADPFVLGDESFDATRSASVGQFVLRAEPPTPAAQPAASVVP